MSNILMIATGGCGGKLLETGLTYIEKTVGLYNVYSGIFMNSNKEEMQILNHYNSSNGLVIDGGGSGRNRDIAKASLIADRSKFINYILNKIGDKDFVYIMTSGDGGFGNGTVLTISKFIRQISPHIGIGILAAMPKKNSRRKSLENACMLHEEIESAIASENERVEKELAEGMNPSEIALPYINSVQYIDNNKQASSEDQFNKKVMKLLIDSFELRCGQVDERDMLLVNSAQGYKVILPIDDSYRKLSTATEKAIESSPFVLPDDFYKADEDGSLSLLEPISCSRIGATFDEDSFDKEMLNKILLATDLDKIDYNKEGKNLIIAGGLCFPRKHMYNLNIALMELDEMVDKKKEDEKSDKRFEFVRSENKNNCIDISFNKKETKINQVRRAKEALGLDFFKL